MEACRSLIDNKLIDLNPTTLTELLSRGYNQLLEDKQGLIGSSTACIIALHREKSILHTANLGDSGFVVIRKNVIIHRSQEQQHYFNSPFQLSIHPPIKETGLIADRYLGFSFEFKFIFFVVVNLVLITHQSQPLMSKKMIAF